MSQLLYVLALLACPVGMGAMMWMMSRHAPAVATETTDKELELARMRAELDQLRAGRAEAGGAPSTVTAPR